MALRTFALSFRSTFQFAFRDLFKSILLQQRNTSLFEPAGYILPSDAERLGQLVLTAVVIHDLFDIHAANNSKNCDAQQVGLHVTLVDMLDTQG
jgi:hypothetical protein